MTEAEKKFIVDSWAWIEYFEGSQTGKKVADIVEDEKNTVICSSLTLAEIVSKFARKQMDFKEVVYGITSLSRVIEVDELMAVSSGEIHASVRKYIKDFGLVDAFLLSIARSSHAKILTGDPHFKGFPEATMLFTK